MKKAMFIKKIILFIALISFILSCNNSQNSNHNINANNELYSDIIFEEIGIEEIEIEEIIINEIEIEEIKIEEIEIEEIIIEEIEIFENTLYEDIIIEDVHMEFTSIKDFNDNCDNCFSSDALIYDIDWADVLGKFSIGAAVIIGTGVISFTSAAMGQTQLAFVFATSSKEALREALIGAAIGGALNTAVETIKSGGFIEESALKYAIEGAADGFMWGAIGGASLGLYKGFKILSKNPILDSSGKLIGIPDEFGNLVDDYGKIKGTILDNDFIADNNNIIIGKLDDSGNFTRNYKSYIPDDGFIYTVKSKNPRFELKGKSVYRISNGEYIGEIDDAGRIIKDGNLVSRIDKNNKIMPSIQESVSKGVKLSPDGKVLNLGDFKIESYIEKGIRNLIKNSSEIAGQIDENGKLIDNWREILTKARNEGVKKAKDCIIKNNLSYAEAIKLGVIGKSVSKSQYERFLKEKGKGLVGHHIKSVASNPNYANRPDNIIFLPRDAHLEMHGGNFHNQTTGNFTKLKCK